MQRQGRSAASALARARQRILAELDDGLRHGHFDTRLTDEAITGGHRRLTLHAGTTYQLLPRQAWDREVATASRRGRRREAEHCISRAEWFFGTRRR
jgi:hypothetical protein